MNKIFVIGFPKCGTTSIHESIIRKGIKSIHWAEDWVYQKAHPLEEIKKGVVGSLIEKAKKEKKKLLSYLDKYQAITQMEVCYTKDCCYWPQLLDVPTLNEQYPNSRFIFNDRNIKKWIISITNWKINSWPSLRERISNLDLPGLPAGVCSDSDLEKWYNWHKDNMINYFKDKDNFIIFNIENDPHQKLGEFLGIKNFTLSHSNKSSRKHN